MHTLLRQALGLLLWLLLAYGAGAIGAVASVEARSFYGQLTRPEWAPPGWVFAPVWSTLYTMMGVAAWLVWRRDGLKAGRVPLLLFIAQLAVNALWSWLFFAWRQGGWALVEVLVLWVLIAATCVAFRRRSTLAGVLLLPYLAWVGFAAVLNHTLWRINPDLL